ncbi:hypothetical protein Tco_0063485, partial [Tanacetum coccineum]
QKIDDDEAEMKKHMEIVPDDEVEIDAIPLDTKPPIIKCLADASLHVPLNDIKIDKTLRFVEKPVEILDREVKSLKRSRIALVKVRWESKRGPEFTWEREDYMKTKYPELFVDRDNEIDS